MQLSPKLTRFLVVVAILAGGVLLFAGYFLMQLTASVDLSSLERPTRYDAKQVLNKMKLLDDSRTNTTAGYIRLAEVEVNSYLHAHHTHTNQTGTSTLALQNCRVDLTLTNISFYCRVTKPWLGRTWRFVWQRTAALRQEGGHWRLELESMHVGRLQIPPAYWSKVNDQLGVIDAEFADDLRWLRASPSITLTPHDVTRRPELRLFNRAEIKNVPTAAK